MRVLPCKPDHGPHCYVHTYHYPDFCRDLTSLLNALTCFHRELDALDETDKRCKFVEDKILGYLPNSCTELWAEALKTAKVIIDWETATPQDLGNALLFAADTEKLQAFFTTCVLVNVFGVSSEDLCRNLSIFAGLWASDPQGMPLQWRLSTCTCCGDLTEQILGDWHRHK